MCILVVESETCSQYALVGWVGGSYIYLVGSKDVLIIYCFLSFYIDS